MTPEDMKSSIRDTASGFERATVEQTLDFTPDPPGPTRLQLRASHLFLYFTESFEEVRERLKQLVTQADSLGGFVRH